MESNYKLAENVEIPNHDGKTFGLVRWEEACPTICGADFSGAVFGRSVSGSISNVTFIKCDFALAMVEQNFYFRNCRFIECNFNKTIFTKTTFSSTSFTSSDFIDCSLEGVVFNHCYVDDARFTEGTFIHDLSARATIFSSSRFVCDFYECDGFFDTFYLYDNQLIDCEVKSEGFNRIGNKIPSEGSFIGWKAGVIYESKTALYLGQVMCRCLIKLRIPEDAKRLCAIHKCRASKVEVLEITDLDTGEELPAACSPLYPFVYQKGQTYECSEFDERPWIICAPGFHFFLDKRDAIAWLKYNI